MTDEKLKELAKKECAKLLKSEKSYNGLSFQEFWAEGVKYGLAEGKKENEELKKICDFNCPDHKLATHNACLVCPAIRNSPYYNLKNVTDEELQEIIKDATAELEM